MTYAIQAEGLVKRFGKTTVPRRAGWVPCAERSSTAC